MLERHALDKYYFYQSVLRPCKESGPEVVPPEAKQEDRHNAQLESIDNHCECLETLSNASFGPAASLLPHKQGAAEKT